MEVIKESANRGDRDKVGCIVLGRGEDEKVREWLSTAAQVAGFIGSAIGRAVFWSPLNDWLANKTTWEAAVDEIARRYREFVNVFEKDLYFVRAGR
jgi:myo-inositol catabolism protein IolC